MLSILNSHTHCGMTLSLTADGDHADGGGGQRFIFRLRRFVNLFFVFFIQKLLGE